MPNLIPEKAKGFKVYLDGDELLGIAEGNLPSGEFMTQEIKGAGIAGVIDAPVDGYLQSMTMSLTWRVATGSLIKICNSDGHALDLYAENEFFNAGTGKVIHQSLHAYIKARTKSFDLGKLVVGETTDAQTEHEIYYMKIFLDGSAVMEMDKYNHVYRVNGVDYLEESRRMLGMI